MKNLLAALFLLIAMSSEAATIQWYSQQPLTTTLGDSDILAIEVSGPQGYKSFTLQTLKDFIGANGSDTFVTNLYATNFYSTNVYIDNAFITNLWTTNAYITNATIYNLRGNSQIFNNSYISNLYATNVYVAQTITNYYLFSTNLYLSYPTYTNNTYVSNYFQTNAFLNTYISNFFNTNVYEYWTNIYNFSTNLTVTNFYKNDTYVSNFFNTNVFNNDTYVSNFFATNIYNAYQISSNYYYQLSVNLTNPVMYGNALLLGYEGNTDPSLTVMGSAGYTVYLDGKYGDIGLSGTVYASGFSHYEDDWAGPTNSIDMSTSDQYFIANSDCQITGFINPPPDPQQTWEGLLTITNSAATNITIRFPAGIKIPERTTSVTVSNVSQGLFSMKYHHRAGTNGVYRQF